MDLIRLFKNAVRNPLNFTNLFVIFVTLFICLITGLTLYTIWTNMSGSNGESACDSSKTMSVSGTAKSTEDKTYLIDFKGNSYCFFSAFVTWTDPNSSVKMWLYDPSGNVNVLQPNKSQTYNFVYSAAPVSKGAWRLVLKSDSSKEVGYSGEISIK